HQLEQLYGVGQVLFKVLQAHGIDVAGLPGFFKDRQVFPNSGKSALRRIHRWHSQRTNWLRYHCTARARKNAKATTACRLCVPSTTCRFTSAQDYSFFASIFIASGSTQCLWSAL